MFLFWIVLVGLFVDLFYGDFFMVWSVWWLFWFVCVVAGFVVALAT